MARQSSELFYIWVLDCLSKICYTGEIYRSRDLKIYRSSKEAIMARTTGTASLADLLANGTLKAGERLVINRRSAAGIEGTLQRDGSIKVGTTTHKTPSAAARAGLQSQAADGWLRWRVPRLGGKTLAELRNA